MSRAMTDTITIPTVRFKDLCPDRCNFKDKAFEAWVDDFMRRHMPGFDIGLLETAGHDAIDRWQIEPEDRFVVAKLSLVVYTCHDCGEEYPLFDEGPDYAEEPKEVCCPLAALAKQGGEEEEIELYEREDRTWLVLSDTHQVNEDYVDTAGDYQIDLPDGDSVWGWYESDSEDARQKATEMNYEAMHEDQHGFPWANGWCFIPDDRITDQELKDAGFTVALYCGGSGNWREDSEYRLAGLDGGGYSFKGAHYAPLAAAVAASRNWLVETDQGQAHITMEDE